MPDELRSIPGLVEAGGTLYWGVIDPSLPFEEWGAGRWVAVSTYQRAGDPVLEAISGTGVSWVVEATHGQTMVAEDEGDPVELTSTAEFVALVRELVTGLEPVTA